MKIDLDAARAARREAAKEQPTITLNGKTFTLPLELPLSLAEAFIGFGDIQDDEVDMKIPGILAGVMRSLLGDQYESFMAEGPSLDDLMVILNGMKETYGVDLGEQLASAGSSNRASRRSRQTSHGTTASLSAKRATGTTR